VIIPLLVSNLLALSVFAQTDSNFGSRWSNIITILLALFAFMPSLRDKIPNTPQMTLSDKLVFGNVIVVTFVSLNALLRQYFNEIIISFVLFAIACAFSGTMVLYFLFRYFAYRFQSRTGEEYLVKYENKKKSEDVDAEEWTTGALSNVEVAEKSLKIFKAKKEKKTEKEEKKETKAEKEEKKKS